MTPYSLPPILAGRRVAIVHDWLNQYGGAEEVLEELHALFPEAPIFVSMYDPERVPAAYREWDIRTTPLQHAPKITSHHQVYLPFYPLAFANLRLTGYDLILSNSSGFCHGIPDVPGALHFNYCLTPPRYVWNLDTYVQREQRAAPFQAALKPLVTWLRQWDRTAVRSVDEFAGISRTVVSRIRRCYGQPAALVYPPVDVAGFQRASEVDDYFLVVSRLIPYKRVDLAVRACTALNLPLVVVGDGRDRKSLEALAGPTVRFMGYVSAEQRRELLSRCRAFIFPGEDDFGIAPVQALASGRPVIAFRAGGALDTVVPGITGEYFTEPTVDSLSEVLAAFQADRYDPEVNVRQAERFDRPRFRRRLLEWMADGVTRRRESAKSTIDNSTTVC